MIGYGEALRIVLESAGPLPARRVALDDALGRVAAEDVIANEPVPPFTNSGMDGFAVRAADVAGATDDAPVRLRVLGRVPAGRIAGAAVTAGTALRIMTGAPLPSGADAVAPVEGAAMAGEWVELRRPVGPGANIRPAGEDLSPGTCVVARGTVLRPADIGLLAEIGAAGVVVHPRPRLAVVTTGDELVEVSERRERGGIRDANIHAVSAQARAFGVEALRFPRIPDRREAMIEALRAAAVADAIVTTGGISMGDWDCVKDALADVGAERVFWRVAQKPAGPLGFWRLGGTPVFGAPGNPVAAMIVMEEYVRPLLRRMMGLAYLFRPERQGALAADWTKRSSDRRLQFLRVLVRDVDGALHATLAGPQGSGILSSVARSNALALIPEDVTTVSAGSPVLLHLTEEPEDH